MKQDYTVWCESKEHEEPIKLLITRMFSNELEHKHVLHMQCPGCNTKIEVSHIFLFD